MLSRVVLDAISRASATLDRGAIRFMERQMSRGAKGPPENARELLMGVAEHYNREDTLATPSSFFPPPPQPEVHETRSAGRAGADHLIDVTYPSTYQPFLPQFRDELASYPENLTARARIYAHRQPRPAIICLHGWGGGAWWLEERAFLVAYLVRIGLDVVLFQLPYHGDRTPRLGSRSGSLFPSQNVVRTNEAFGQAIYDLRGLAMYLRERGAPAVGVTGMSLGGYTSALWASLDDTLAFAAPMIPAVSMSGLMWQHGKATSARRRAEKVGVSRELLDQVFAVHAPLTRPVKLPRERLLIVGGRGDRITPPEQARALWRHWGEPDLHWFPGGHLAQVGRGDGFRALRRKLTELDLISGRGRAA
jgi:pimeloyl-ACP methyl ester carboxylesterase